MNKGAGIDLITAKILRKMIDFFTPILTKIFNKSLSSGVFPDIWKTALITPIFKSGNRRDVSNYRGISILSLISKIFERLVRRKIDSFVSRLIDQSQHGFETGKSTVTNLSVYTLFIRKCLNQGQQVDAIYTDFSKAFDKVDHGLLLFK